MLTVDVLISSNPSFKSKETERLPPCRATSMISSFNRFNASRAVSMFERSWFFWMSGAPQMNAEEIAVTKIAMISTIPTVFDCAFRVELAGESCSCIRFKVSVRCHKKLRPF